MAAVLETVQQPKKNKEKYKFILPMPIFKASLSWKHEWIFCEEQKSSNRGSFHSGLIYWLHSYLLVTNRNVNSRHMFYLFDNQPFQDYPMVGLISLPPLANRTVLVLRLPYEEHIVRTCRSSPFSGNPMDPTNAITWWKLRSKDCLTNDQKTNLVFPTNVESYSTSL